MDDGPGLRLRFVPGLRMLMTSRRRAAEVRTAPDGTSSLGHVVESLGVPLTEVGELLLLGGTGPGRAVDASYRPRDGDVVEVRAVRRPEPLPGGGPPRFLLDVHLGGLARRLRLVGIDTDYRNDLDDPALVERANAGRRLLLTQDRGLLRRRALWRGAFVRGARPDEQLTDVLDRFAPPLAPWSRCLSCNGELVGVPKGEIEHVLRLGTRRSYDAFTRCPDCGRVYWPGAHRERLEAVVAAAERTAAG